MIAASGYASKRCPKCGKPWTAIDIHLRGKNTVIVEVWHAPKKCLVRYHRP